MRPLKEKISITIDNDILKYIKILSEKDSRSVSQYINMVLREHIEQKNNSVLENPPNISIKE